MRRDGSPRRNLELPRVVTPGRINSNLSQIIVFDSLALVQSICIMIWKTRATEHIPALVVINRYVFAVPVIAATGIVWGVQSLLGMSH